MEFRELDLSSWADQIPQGKNILIFQSIKDYSSILRKQWYHRAEVGNNP
jgi:hypothetical protein